jgi:hypothetical protein
MLRDNSVAWGTLLSQCRVSVQVFRSHFFSSVVPLFCTDPAGSPSAMLEMWQSISLLWFSCTAQCAIKEKLYLSSVLSCKVSGCSITSVQVGKHSGLWYRRLSYQPELLDQKRPSGNANEVLVSGFRRQKLVIRFGFELLKYVEFHIFYICTLVLCSVTYYSLVTDDKGELMPHRGEMSW